jgi:hypothetical protein
LGDINLTCFNVKEKKEGKGRGIKIGRKNKINGKEIRDKERSR